MRKHYTLNEHKFLYNIENIPGKLGWDEDGNVGIPRAAF